MAKRAKTGGGDHLHAAREQWRRGDVEGTARLYEEALAGKPGDVEALEGLARVEVARGNLARALEHVAAIEAAAPGRAETLVIRGVIAERSGAESEALERFADAARRDPRSFAARFNHARLLAKHRHWVDAAAEYGAALRLEPTNQAAKLQGDIVVAQVSRLAERISNARRAVALNPTFRDGYLTLADALLESDMDGDARATLLAARERFAKDREVLERLVIVHQRHLQLGEARGVLREIVELAPGDGEAWRRLALLELVTGEPNRAEEAAKKAAGLAPKDPEVPFAQGVIYESAKAWDLAKAAYKRALKLRPEHWGAMTNLGRILATDEKPDLAESVKLLRKARQLAPAEAAPALNLALALEAKGEKAGAEEAARAVLALAAAPAAQKDQARRVLRRLEKA